MSDAFMWGFVAGAAVWSLLAWWQHGMYQKILAGKGQGEHRTAEKLHDGFYYIVPEGEYNEMDRMRAWYRNGGTDAAYGEWSKEKT